MHDIFRWIIGHVVMLPFSISFIFLSLFFGKPKAASLIGKILTKISVRFLGTLIPKMIDNDRFTDFKNKIIWNFQNFKVLYDVEVKNESDNFVEFKILNCPFTSALKNFGSKELCRFVCAGDFIVANKNRLNWKFSRTHSHGTDGKCCNHTYYSLATKHQEELDS
jgi:hypothetical protein